MTDEVPGWARGTMTRAKQNLDSLPDTSLPAFARRRLGPRRVHMLQGVAGDKVKFHGDRYTYTVVGVAGEGRWLICFCPQHGISPQRWCLVDFELDIRGPDDHYGYCGYETPQGVAAMIAGLESGQVEVSHRHRIPLDLKSVEFAERDGGES